VTPPPDRERAALLRRVHRCATQARNALAERDAGIVAAVAAGASQVQVGEAAGLSHVGVGKIIRRMATVGSVDTTPPEVVNSVSSMFVVTTPRPEQ
jgi:hypothetical protein